MSFQDTMRGKGREGGGGEGRAWTVEVEGRDGGYMGEGEREMDTSRVPD